MSSPSASTPPSDDLSNLVTECILAFEREGPTGVDRLLAQHPEQATDARSKLEALREAVRQDPNSDYRAEAESAVAGGA